MIKNDSTQKAIAADSSAKITWLMFIASILIVLRHSSGYDDFKLIDGRTFDNAVVAIVNTFRFGGIFNLTLPFFFFMSGLLFFKSYSNTAYVSKLKSRITSLLIPYLFWNSIWMLFMICITMVPQITAQLNSLQLFEPSINSVVQGVLLHLYHPVFWYVKQLIVYAVAAPLVYECIRRKYISILVLIVYYLLEFFLCVWGGVNPLHGTKDSLVRGFLFYAIGGYVGTHWLKVVNYRFNRITQVACGIVLLLSFLVYPLVEVNAPLTFLFTCMQVVMFWIAFDFVRGKTVPAFAKLSFFYYAVHNYIQLSINKVSGLILRNFGGMGVIVNFFGGALVTVLLMFVAAVLISKKFPKLWRIMSGSRGL